MTALDTPIAPFAQRLREATRAEHSDAESKGFITALMGGELGELDYWRLLGQYLPLYIALEEAIGEAAGRSELAASFHDERLARADAIRADLTARFGTVDPVVDGVRLAAPLAATLSYAERIRSASVPALLAHHYLRYLGDLSGGQAIGALVARHYAVPREQLTMWDFSEIDAPKRVKDAYRARLDAITDPAVQEEFLAEAREGYRLAGALFAGLDPR
ncbi:biliverdin-producing heme oxygenase [Brachybacterium subflavum]|uniref:biliverdin-producing heme oxygenase n=1 Tax=Brachybacterium subflavum TaxID=2585206 RepID=UPI0012665D1B|nr:biliverdin-producing heme oxygenase [Brachybacterium subflavum]